MRRLIKAATYVCALVGALVIGASGYVYATNCDLVTAFWNVRQDVRAVPDQRRLEVIAELPARITFEREVRADMESLPEDRQAALYEQLARSREQVFTQFAQRIRQEAEIARIAKSAAEATEKIVETLGKVSVGVSLRPEPLPAPRPDLLARVEDARLEVANARATMHQARQTADGEGRVQAALGILVALDKLGDEIVVARALTLSDKERRRLETIVHDAKETLYATRQTPGLDENPQAMALLAQVPPKLSS